MSVELRPRQGRSRAPPRRLPPAGAGHGQRCASVGARRRRSPSGPGRRARAPPGFLRAGARRESGSRATRASGAPRRCAGTRGCRARRARPSRRRRRARADVGARRRDATTAAWSREDPYRRRLARAGRRRGPRSQSQHRGRAPATVPAALRQHGRRGFGSQSPPVHAEPRSAAARRSDPAPASPRERDRGGGAAEEDPAAAGGPSGRTASRSRARRGACAPHRRLEPPSARRPPPRAPRPTARGLPAGPPRPSRRRTTRPAFERPR